MRIVLIAHKGLKRLVEDDDASGLQPAVSEKLRRMISFLQDMSSESELRDVPTWKAHKLSGNRSGIWSLFVTKNWRLNFIIEKDDIEITDLNYEDYH
jgi:toxin HigB-1